jgi:hypothetical protein
MDANFILPAIQEPSSALPAYAAEPLRVILANRNYPYF